MGGDVPEAQWEFEDGWDSGVRAAKSRGPEPLSGVHTQHFETDWNWLTGFILGYEHEVSNTGGEDGTRGTSV